MAGTNDLSEGCVAGLEFAKDKIDHLLIPANLRLLAGEMTAQEMRTTTAILKYLSTVMRDEIASIKTEK